MSNVITLRNCRKGYGKKTVLQDLTLDIPEGSVLGLLGKNGAGKTTLLKCVLGLLKSDTGEIRTLGEDPWNFSEETKARLGYVPQGYRPYPWLSAGKLIDYTASFYKNWQRPLVAKLVAEWALDLSTPVGVLSEGEMQKLLIILALGHEPELLIFDEPVASLDPAARRDFLRTILTLAADRKCTVFFSTHITSDLERVADTVAVLRNGTIDFVGGLDTLKDMVKRVRFSFGNRAIPEIILAGVLHKVITPQSALLTVRGYDTAMHQALEKAFESAAEVEDLNLEEIFLEMTR